MGLYYRVIGYKKSTGWRRCSNNTNPIATFGIGVPDKICVHIYLSLTGVAPCTNLVYLL